MSIKVSHSINKLFLFFLTTVIFACGNHSDRSHEENTSTERLSKSEEVVSSLRKDEFGCVLKGDTDLSQINGVPIAFYLEHEEIDQLSKAYFKGEYQITDDEKTFGIMDSLDTKNESTRPLYFYNMFKMVGATDGALTEIIGQYIADYVAKFPQEFVCYMQQEPFSYREKDYLFLIGFNLYSNKMRKEFSKKVVKACEQCPQPTQAKLDEYLARIAAIKE